MQIDSVVYRLAEILEKPARYRNIVLSKIWYRHVVTINHTQLGDLSHDQIRLWVFDRPQRSIYWETIPGDIPGMKLHVAFRRREDAVMFRLKAT
jgi:hypothetical protein